MDFDEDYHLQNMFDELRVSDVNTKQQELDFDSITGFGRSRILILTAHVLLDVKLNLTSQPEEMLKSSKCM